MCDLRLYIDSIIKNEIVEAIESVSNRYTSVFRWHKHSKWS